MDDLERLRDEYENRAVRLGQSDLYSVFNPAYLYMLQQRQRAEIKTLSKNFLSSSDLRILEIGCGSGNILLEYLRYGARLDAMHGLDLLLDRVKEAKRKLPSLQLTCSNGESIPYKDNAFDLVLQYTAFSSILDARVKRNMAGEMLRVLKPEGRIIWYDFWLNPTNKQTKGIKPAEIRSLFPGCKYEFHKITLAPPIARRLVPLSWGLAHFLESLKLFNTHYLAIISK